MTSRQKAAGNAAPPDYKDIYDYRERRGVSVEKLTQQINRILCKSGVRPGPITRSYISKILSRSRRCPYDVALALSQVSFVPVENLFGTAWRDKWSRKAKRKQKVM